MQRAVIVMGHGSLRSASGAAMIRIAARLREIGLAPLVEACFLNYSRPTLAETIAKCVQRGAGAITVQPYFLIGGAYVRHELADLVREAARQYPQLRFDLAEPFLDHPALIALATKRARAALAEQNTTSSVVQESAACGLLLMAHGTPLAEANAPLYAIAAAVRERCACHAVQVGYLDCNEPDIVTAGAVLVEAGCEQILALPYFLHLGRHVREDLPALVRRIQMTYPDRNVMLAHHLDYDLLLVDAIVDRVRQVETIEPKKEAV